MAIRARRNSRQNFDIWPGFVDALSGLLIIMLFVLTVFMVAQFFLGEMLSGQDRTISRLQGRIAELARMLSLEQTTAEEARRRAEQLQLDLRATIEARDRARSERDAARERAGRLESQVESQREATQEERQRRLTAEEQLDLLNRQVAALRAQLAAIQEALEASEATREQQETQIEDLGRRLNAALATEVQRLRQYRSDFFGRVREALGEREDIQIVGDRFVFQSEVLFPSASDDLQPGGEEQLARVANVLKDVMAQIPDDIDWVLRVDGHTDVRPLRADHPDYSDNLELSAARAISVVRFLQSQGIPADRLVAAGFGEHHPLVDERNPEAYARNRRIELKLTQR